MASEDSARTAEAIVERFGGIRPMAAKLSVPVTTVQGWKKRGHIPASRRVDLIAAAAQHGIALSEAELDLATAGDESATAPEPRPETPRHQPPEEPPAASAAEQPTFQASPTSPKALPLAPSSATARVATARPAKAPRGGLFLSGLSFLLALAAVGGAGLALYRQGGLPPYLPGAPNPLEAEILSLRGQLLSQAMALAELRARTAMGVPVPTGTAPVDLSPLTERIAMLEARFASIDPTAAEAVPVQADTGQEERAARLADDLAQLKGLAVATGQNLELTARRLDELAKRLDTLEAEGGGAEGQALVVAAGQLHIALMAGRPFARELNAIAALASEDPALDRAMRMLRPKAEAGLVPLVALKERFDDLAGEILRADRQRPDAGWGEQALARVAALITVRRSSGEVAGGSADAVVARADAALRRGDLALAVAELEGLSGSAGEAAAPWLADARARVAAEAASEALADRFVHALTGSGAAP